MTMISLISTSISYSFERDHDRLEGLFQDYQRLKLRDFPRARECFLQFEFGLGRHFAWEEDILFPLFESKTGIMENAATTGMRKEHREITQELDVMKKKILSGSPNTGREEERLLILMGNHSLKEESVLYPFLDEQVDEVERQKIFQQMEDLPVSRYELPSTAQRQGPEGERK